MKRITVVMNVENVFFVVDRNTGENLTAVVMFKIVLHITKFTITHANTYCHIVAKSVENVSFSLEVYMFISKYTLMKTRIFMPRKCKMF